MNITVNKLRQAKISMKNSKMGMVASVSLPAGISCPTDIPCFKACYAAKIERIYKNTKNAYIHNWELWQEDEEMYFESINDFLKYYGGISFRWHVSGDIPSYSYLDKMVTLAKKHPHIKFLCYTKNYNVVNRYIKETGSLLPSNLSMMFSKWDGYAMPNPYNLPVAYVELKNGNVDELPTKIMKCPNQVNKKWTCDNCAARGMGCYAGNTDILFKEH